MLITMMENDVYYKNYQQLQNAGQIGHSGKKTLHGQRVVWVNNLVKHLFNKLLLHDNL